MRLLLLLTVAGCSFPGYNRNNVDLYNPSPRQRIYVEAGGDQWLCDKNKTRMNCHNINEETRYVRKKR